MQDLYGEREQLFDQLMQELEALRRTGQQYAENEAIMAIKLRIKTVDADIQRTWTSGGTGEGGFL